MHVFTLTSLFHTNLIRKVTKKRKAIGGKIDFVFQIKIYKNDHCEKRVGVEKRGWG